MALVWPTSGLQPQPQPRGLDATILSIEARDAGVFRCGPTWLPGRQSVAKSLIENGFFGSTSLFAAADEDKTRYVVEGAASTAGADLPQGRCRSKERRS